MVRILVVDDDKLIRWSLKEIFSQEGFMVDTVASTDEALKHAEDNPYHLIFADLEINDEDGFEMLKKVRVLQKDTKIIILSALTRNQIESQLGDLNIFSIVEKPFESVHIKSIAKEALDSPNLGNGGDNLTEKKLKGKVF